MKEKMIEIVERINSAETEEQLFPIMFELHEMNIEHGNEFRKMWLNLKETDKIIQKIAKYFIANEEGDGNVTNAVGEELYKKEVKGYYKRFKEYRENRKQEFINDVVNKEKLKGGKNVTSNT